MNITPPTLPNITSKGDLAVFGLGYAVGFILYIVIFRLSDPPPTTVALVVAIASLAVKSAIEALLEEEPAPISEQERRDALRNRFMAFKNLFYEGIRLYVDGRISQLYVHDTVELESRWESNPNYDPNDSEGRYVPQYIQHEVTEELSQRVLALQALWEVGVVTDEYAEARLDELSDLCSRRASSSLESVEVVEDHFFGDRLRELMRERGIRRTELAQATGLHSAIIVQLESYRSEPDLNTIRLLSEALEIDPMEFLPPQSNS